MRRLCGILLISSTLCIGMPAAMAGMPSSGHEQLLQRAEQLLNNYKDIEALVLYEEVLAESPDNYEALCKASFLHSRIGDRYQDETRKIEHFSKARQYAVQAYELSPHDAESNYVMALAMASEAMVSGPRQRLVDINEVKRFADAALACNSEHAGAWHILGRWYFKMANLNFAEKAASKLLFGGVNKATNQEAADAIEKAIAYNPNNIRYYYDLACIYEEMKEKEACISTLQKALTVNLETKDELELSRRCNIMLQEQQKL
ncbi:tetratricopeptide repeat protein [Pontibacter ummariensis]|uniref:Tetratricopeptide repeat-containing protein n=1 Tax=Pontibacter ummariensis TaxID=1610492 RepID=A0A239FUK0_9BACT|nr:tetratricopeptide repeat protein [Pontibacter ummariensis]PRY11950.1 tetratricopeptide repeat protein [Pontibacter ummariensis]SNS59594.1 Tetratricopeptide repeat-containing protein [Pontibacter ummariensis]